MRKAGLKNRSRRNRTSNGNGGPNSSATGAPNYSGSHDGGAQGCGGLNHGGVGERRKPTTEEAALTAKNYRLAKELSDLRVRHRDETRVVTRLTMENMNLASRCREAISHVAMLKKELAMQQKRASEMMALQVQQQSQRMQVTPSSIGRSPSAELPGSTSAPIVSRNSAADLHFDLPSSQPPPPQQLSKQSSQKTSMNTSTPQDQANPGLRSSPAGNYPGFDLAFDNTGESGPSDLSGIPKKQSFRRETKPKRNQSEQQQPRSSPSDDMFDVTHTLGLTKKPDSNHSLSTMENFNETDDAPADEMMLDGEESAFNSTLSTDFFAHSKAPSLPTTPEKGNLDDSIESAFSVSQFRTKSSSKRANKKRDGKEPDTHMPESPKFGNPAVLGQNRKSISSSIDAFEASFNTTFPTTFSSTNAEPPSSLDMSFDVPEFSDPFFLGSVDGGGASSSSTFHESSSGRASVENLEMSTNKSGENEKVSHSHKAAANTANDLAAFGKGDNSLPDPDSGNTALENSPQLNSILKEWDGADDKNQTSDSSNSDISTRNISNQGFSSATSRTGSDLPTPSNLFPASAMSTFEQISEEGQDQTHGKIDEDKQGVDMPGDKHFLTPPLNPTSKSSSDTPTGPSPQRPEKVPSSSVRARYDAAMNIKSSSRSKLDQQTNQSESSEHKGSEGSRTLTNHSPTLVLRRLHQRRAKEKANDYPAPEESTGDFPPESAPPRNLSTSFSKGVSQENNTLVGNVTGGVHERSPSDEAFLHNEIKEKRNGSTKSNGARGNGKGSSLQKSLSAKNHSNQPSTAGSPFRKSNSTRNGNKMSPDTMNAEIRQLDAIANASSTNTSSAPVDAASGFSSVYGKRRNVKQPVSYTEPSLHSKLRRGDVFFPKTEPKSTSLKNRDDNGKRVLTLKSAAESNSGDSGLSGGQQSKTSEEVLKDLAASSGTPVFS